MITGDPGTEAQVINTGDENNAVFDFIIPRGEPGGGGGAPEVLATVDTSSQPSAAGQALIFNDTPLVSGSAITHQPGSPNVVINQPGIYQATFHGTVAVNTGTTIPSSIDIQLLQNGAAVPGAVASHSFASTNEVATMSFSVPFRVDAVPADITVTANQDGFQFNEVTLTIIRLGDSTS